jgi:heme-degrading monooxygenase HmoA
LKSFEPDGEYVVLASSIPARRMSSTGRMFSGASAVRKQLEATEGVMGFSLLARPLNKEYATLSVWTDEKALAAFAEATPHGKLMADLSKEMGPTRFIRWTMKGSEGKPSWGEALKRLA